jgi:hypothetical protein
LVCNHKGFLGVITNRDEESDERRAVETPLDLDETVRSLRAELQSFNKRLIKEQGKQIQINIVFL